MSKNGPYAKNGFTFCDKIKCDDNFIAIFNSASVNYVILIVFWKTVEMLFFDTGQCNSTYSRKTLMTTNVCVCVFDYRSRSSQHHSARLPSSCPSYWTGQLLHPLPHWNGTW